MHALVYATSVVQLLIDTILIILVVSGLLCHRIGNLDYGLDQNGISTIHVPHANCHLSKAANFIFDPKFFQINQENRTPKTKNLTQGDYVRIVNFLFLFLKQKHHNLHDNIQHDIILGPTSSNKNSFVNQPFEKHVGIKIL